jgi:dolichol kinase
MNIHTELINAGIISGIYLLIFMSAELWQAIGKPKTETTRKFVHFAAGAVCLSFAYLFTSHMTILGLGVLFLIVMMITKKFGLLKSVHDVKRRTGGSIYYPIAVYFSFLIAHNAGKPEFYLIAILVLALSDSLAALIGGRYGLKLYKVEEDHKSLEGSVVFFFSTFLIVLLGLLLLSDIGRTESILIAAYVALMVTAFEAISLNGADNLFIPIGTLVVLLNVTNESVLGLLIRIGIIALIFLIVFCIVRYTKVIGLSGIIGIALMGYAAWMLVGYDWVFPVIVSLLLYGLTDLFIETSANNNELYRIRTVFYVALVSFIWILTASYTKLPKEIFFVPFVINLSAHLGILWHRKARLDPNGYYIPFPQWIRNPHIITRSTILVMVLTLANLIVNSHLNVAATLTLALIGTIVTEIIYWQFESRYRGKFTDIQFLKVTSLIILVISTLICIPAIMIYFPEFFL